MPIAPEKSRKLVCANEIARRFGISASTLKLWRDKRDGKVYADNGEEYPKYYSFGLGTKKLYDLDEFVADLARVTDSCRGREV